MFLAFFRISIVATLWLLAFNYAYCADVTITKINELDKHFKTLSSEVYKKTIFIEKKPPKNIKSLYKITQKLNTQNKHHAAIKYIIQYKKLITENIDDDSIFFFINLLLKHNEWNTAYKLYQQIKAEGDKSLISNATFIFVKYYIDKNEWDKTLNLLTDIFDDLTIDDGHYALIMKGVALQYKKKHRVALQYYKQIPSSSKFYNQAQLNIAIVFIRQGWWADAHIVINKLLTKKTNDHLDPELRNRLYLVLGYSFLQQEYFRESRNAFRNIEQQSQYADRALLGISLAASSQGDNFGALNVLNILNGKKSQVLAVEESYLLLPFVYEKIGQLKTASASYTIALNYYKKRIYELKSIIKNINNNSVNNIKINQNLINIKNNNINFTEEYPISFLNNLKEIKAFKTSTMNIKLTRKINSLLNKYNTILVKIIVEKLNTRIIFLENYLNQSQFGIARLYDNSKTLNKL